MSGAPTIIISEKGPASSALSAANIRDLAHLRRLLLQSLFAIEVEGNAEVVPPIAKLHLLRGFLANVGAAEKQDARRLLLLALLQLEDEDEQKRLVMPHPLLPVVAPKG